MKADLPVGVWGEETTYIVMWKDWKETKKGFYQKKRYKYFTDWEKARAFADENRSCTLYETKIHYI